MLATHPTTIARALLAAAASVSALALPASALADEPVTVVAHDTPLAGHAGWDAWSRSEGDRYRLVLRDPSGKEVVPPLPSLSQPWDVSLGPDAHGRTVAVYSRCASTGCDVRRLDVETGREEKLESVSSETYSERTPAIWGSTVAFTRRVDDCDVPYAKTLGSSEPSRQLLKSKCLDTNAGHLALRGSTVAVSSTEHGGRASEVRRYSTKGGSSDVLVRSSWGELPKPYGQVAIDSSSVTTVRTGFGEPHVFTTVDRSDGEVSSQRAHVTLTGSYAEGLYLQALDEEINDCPCRVVEQSPTA
jgi:hypothetical protein